MAGESMTETKPRLLIALLASLSLSACQPSTQDASPGDAASPADWVLQGGKFFTVDEAQVWAEAVAIKDGRFVYVGDDAGAQGFVGADTARHDLGGKLTIPGLVDSHTHPGLMGRETAGYTAVPVGGGPRGRCPGVGPRRRSSLRWRRMPKPTRTLPGSRWVAGPGICTASRAHIGEIWIASYRIDR